MKRKYNVYQGTKLIEREYSYIPVRYVLAVLISVFEVVTIIGIVVLCCYYIPYFYLVAYATEFFCIIKIVSSDDNPDYKVPWLLFVLILPIAGFMLYFLFYSRKLQKKFIRRLGELKKYGYERDDSEIYSEIKKQSPIAAAQAKMLTKISGSQIFTNTKQVYFPLGEDMHKSMLCDLENAESFIFLEYFIIEDGVFWGSLLEILKKKAEAGLVVRVLYDDVGCMSTLPGNYARELKKYGIEAAPFSRLKGNADSEFNNRNHRKILVIDGKIGYTGGVNIADEYINERARFGHWKDTAIRLEGDAVWELTHLFMCDFGITWRRLPGAPDNLYPAAKENGESGYIIPFGDGPKPLYERRVGKSVIQNMLNGATEYVYITTPYLIIDNDLCSTIEQAALRGIDVRIIVPHIPDKRMVFGMTRSFYPRLLRAGVRIYEYTPGFIHAKSCVADGEYAMIGTINLDYRSLVHHFENGIWMYRTDSISKITEDINKTIECSMEITPNMVRTSLLRRFIRSLIKIFSPLL